MRCPDCGSDTNPALPRCTRCDAPLGTPPGGEASPLAPQGDATSREPQDDTTTPVPQGDVTCGDPQGDTTTPDPQGDATALDPRGDAAVRRSQGEEATARDPLGGASGPGGEPVPPPWAGPAPPSWGSSPQGPVQWESPPGPPSEPPSEPPSGRTTPAPPDETTTHLSPEPWAEPAIWQPPPPPKKSRMPYFLVAAGAVLLFGVALGIVFWPSGTDTPAQPAGDVPSAQDESPAPATEEEPGGDVEGQARAVDGLLEDMGATRSDLGGVVVAGCPPSGLQRILEMRKGQLEKARALDVSALGNGPRMKDALVRALEASTESNQRYLDVAPGCPSEAEVADVNQRASGAKSEFLGYWGPVAEQAGLPARTESDI